MVTTIIIFIIIGIVLARVIYLCLEGRKFIGRLALPISIISFFIPGVIAVWYNLNIILYNYISPTVAERGLIFKDTVMLNQYKLIGSKDYVYYKADEYSRSDRHGETIQVRITSKKDENVTK